MDKIIIVSRRLTRKNKLINWVSEIYLHLAITHQVQPVIIPIANGTPAILKEYLNDYSGLLMVEGGDLGPHHYNENYNLDELDEYDELKDEIELACFKHAYESGRPIMGFCRGLHIINAMFGGSNHKDVHDFNHNKIVHIDYNNYDGHRHKVLLENETPLHHWYKKDELFVNSYHHQGIKRLAAPLKPMAFAEDGLIEAVYLPGNQFIVGLQFHPERMFNEYEGNRLVFDSYFNAVNDYKSKH